MKVARSWNNILEGMRTEQQRIADEKAFREHFDYLEGKKEEKRHQTPR